MESGIMKRRMASVLTLLSRHWSAQLGVCQWIYIHKLSRDSSSTQHLFLSGAQQSGGKETLCASVDFQFPIQIDSFNKWIVPVVRGHRDQCLPIVPLLWWSEIMWNKFEWKIDRVHWLNCCWQGRRGGSGRGRRRCTATAGVHPVDGWVGIQHWGNQ